MVLNKIIRFSTRSGMALGLATVLATAVTAEAQSVKEGPFAGLSGSWTGTGTVSVANGSNERIRCRASYSVPPSGEALHQELRCASDSYKFEVSSNVVAAEGGVLSGTWTENTRQVTGAVSGRVTPGQINTSVKGTGFSAVLAVSTRGGRQMVSIKPTGTDIQSIEIEMRKG